MMETSTKRALLALIALGDEDDAYDDDDDYMDDNDDYGDDDDDNDNDDDIDKESTAGSSSLRRP